MDLYSEIILDHFKNPHNAGNLENPDKSATESNPLCGDKIQIDLNLDKEGKITEIAFSGEGCAISQAASSMLTDKVLGMTSKEITSLNHKDIYEMLKVDISPGRAKCALLALETIKKALS